MEAVESAITSKGQATIPKAIREHLRLKPGDRVKFFVHPDGSVATLPKLPARALGHRQAAAKARHDRGDERGRSRWRHRSRAAPKAAMIGLDTNVLVRYLAQDDPVQSAKATTLVDSA